MAENSNPFVLQIAAEHGKDLLRFIARRVRTTDAHDLAQEVYVRLLRLNRNHTSLIRDPEAYLYRVANNLLHEFAIDRRETLLGLRRWSEEQATEDGFTPDASAEAVGVSASVREILRELPAHHRAVLILHRQEGMTYEEIGSRLSISPSTVKKYLGIALRYCRERLRNME